MKSKKILNSALCLTLLFNSGLSAMAQNGSDLYDELLNEATGGSQGAYDQGIQQAPAGQLPPTQYAQGEPLKGRVVVAPAGTVFQARTETPLSSELSQVGDPVTLTVSTPLYADGNILIPAGSQVIGQVVEVNPAKMLRAGASGSIDIQLVSVVTPTGQRFPLSAKVDENQFTLRGSTGTGRAVGALGKTAVGAGSGALAGLVGAAISGGMLGRGAALGTAVGGGIGLAGAAIAKGKDVNIPAGTVLPIKLEQALRAMIPGLQPGAQPAPGY